MGEMADYFIDRRIDEALAFGNSHPCELVYHPAALGYWADGDDDLLVIAEMSDDHIGAAIGWCLKHFPDESREKVAELKAEQVRREFDELP